MEVLYTYAAGTQELLDWAQGRLPAEISAGVQEQLLAIVREIRESEERHTIATLAKALGRDIGSLESDLLYLQQLHVVEVGWLDRLPESLDRVYGWDDGSIFYYPPPPDRREIAVQDDLELYLLALEFCRFRFGRAQKPDTTARRKQLLFSLFNEIRGYEDLVLVKPERNEMRIEFEPYSYDGDSRELLHLLDLLREPGILDVDVRYTRAVTVNLRSGSRQPSATVSVEARWRPDGKGFAPLWRAVKRVWPAVWLEWAHSDLYRKGIEVIGDEEAFQKWLKTPTPPLGGRTRLDIVAEEHGAETFLNILAAFKGGAKSKP